MARGISIPLSISAIPLASYRHYRRHHHRLRLPSLCCSFQCACSSSTSCSSSSSPDAIDMAKYREAFSRRMAMAGLKPHHHIALGVSGGPDSMALCVLTAQWKTNDLNVTHDPGGSIDGILAIVVDHGLRAESKEEANIVSCRVSRMGIRCEIARCEWLEGRPKQGHLQEAAREMRYQQFQKVCIKNQISALLIAHHADDQAELFVIRLSRNSGVLGLAGMPFMSQIFSSYTHSCDAKGYYGTLLVRPLLDFSKEDMYKICQGGEQNWVEDPTNQSLLYTRNRIRMSLRDYSSGRFNSELQAVISACQLTRLYVENTCSNLISKAVTIMDLGYAVIDLEILNQLKIEDIVLSRFITWILQFISQRNRPVRGSPSKLLLEYMKTFPCKTSLTAAGCYLCPAPSSKGTKSLVCYSVNHPLTQTREFFDAESFLEQPPQSSNDIEQIVESSKIYTNHLVPDASEVHFLDASSVSVLTEAKRLEILSDSTYEKILELQREEVKKFRCKPKVIPEFKSKGNVQSISMYSESLSQGKVCSFMNRFFVKWKLNEETPASTIYDEAGHDHDSGTERCCSGCKPCLVSDDTVLEVRHMAESDWLYLATLLKNPTSENFQQQVEQATEGTNCCSDHSKLSAQTALRVLKSIPAAARRGLPVLVTREGLLISIPNIGFKHCPRLDVSAEFRPRVPIGGGHSFFI